MTYIRKADERGAINLGWLTSKHSFSFGSYYDAAYMGHSALRVINDDCVQGGAGFDKHSHADMEIISYVLEGALKHRDSMGNEFIVPAGEVQRMSAGTGITHSEFNESSSAPVKFLQIWIEPGQRGLEPSYQQAQISQSSPLTPIVTADGRADSLTLNQDAFLYRLQLEPGESHQLSLENRSGYLHIIEGALSLEVSGKTHKLKAGDAIGLNAEDESILPHAENKLTALWFDLPA